MKTFKQFLTESDDKDFWRSIEDLGFKQYSEGEYKLKIDPVTEFYVKRSGTNYCNYNYYNKEDEPDQLYKFLETDKEGLEYIVHTIELYKRTQDLSDDELFRRTFYQKGENIEFMDATMLSRHSHNAIWGRLSKILDDPKFLWKYTFNGMTKCSDLYLHILPRKINSVLSIMMMHKYTHLRQFPDSFFLNMPIAPKYMINGDIYAAEDIHTEIERRKAVTSTDKESSDLFGDIFDM